MTSVLQQTLRGLCYDTGWCYAVFWKLKRQLRTVLTWEDAFYEHFKSHDIPTLSPNPMAMAIPASSGAFGQQLSAGRADFEDPIGLSVAKMSYHVYSVGEGIIGRVAFTNKHQWVFSSRDKVTMADGVSNSKMNIRTPPEKYPAGWEHQFAAGIKTIAVIAVPQGVVQLGSRQMVAEDLKLVGHVKALFATLQNVPGAFLSDLVSEVQRGGVHALYSVAMVAPQRPSRDQTPMNLSAPTFMRNLSMPAVMSSIATTGIGAVGSNLGHSGVGRLPMLLPSQQLHTHPQSMPFPEVVGLQGSVIQLQNSLLHKRGSDSHSQPSFSSVKSSNTWAEPIDMVPAKADPSPRTGIISRLSLTTKSSCMVASVSPIVAEKTNSSPQTGIISHLSLTTKSPCMSVPLSTVSKKSNPPPQTGLFGCFPLTTMSCFTGTNPPFLGIANLSRVPGLSTPFLRAESPQLADSRPSIESHQLVGGRPSVDISQLVSGEPSLESAQLIGTRSSVESQLIDNRASIESPQCVIGRPLLGIPQLLGAIPSIERPQCIGGRSSVENPQHLGGLESLQLEGGRPSAESLQLLGGRHSLQSLQLDGGRPSAESHRDGSSRPSAESPQLVSDQPSAEPQQLVSGQPPAESRQLVGSRSSVESPQLVGSQFSEDTRQLVGGGPSAEAHQLGSSRPSVKSPQLDGIKPLVENPQLVGGRFSVQSPQFDGARFPIESQLVTGRASVESSQLVGRRSSMSCSLDLSGCSPVHLHSERSTHLTLENDSCKRASSFLDIGVSIPSDRLQTLGPPDSSHFDEQMSDLLQLAKQFDNADSYGLGDLSLGKAGLNQSSSSSLLCEDYSENLLSLKPLFQNSELTVRDVWVEGNRVQNVFSNELDDFDEFLASLTREEEKESDAFSELGSGFASMGGLISNKNLGSLITENFGVFANGKKDNANNLRGSNAASCHVAIGQVKCEPHLPTLAGDPEVSHWSTMEKTSLCKEAATIRSELQTDRCVKTQTIEFPCLRHKDGDAEMGRQQEVVVLPASKQDKTVRKGKKRSRMSEVARARPRDRQQIQDRVQELRNIIPDGERCSIDTLLEKAVNYMNLLQTVSLDTDRWTQSSKLQIDDGGNGFGHGSDDTALNASWAVELGGQGRGCPIIVENLSQPRQMLVEMLCEEKVFFLEIAESMKRLGLTILKGIMEVRNDKIWARFVVEAAQDVHRVQVLWSLMQLLEPNSSNVTT